MNKQRIAIFSAAAVAAFTVSCAPHARVGVYADPHAQVGVYAEAGPPAYAFESDPYLVPLPGTYAYGVPDYDVDLYYADGYYWRPWQGRWYRSTYYDRGWSAYSGVPFFYSSVPRGWRDDYRANRWRGRSWEYARVPRHEVERNWSSWKRDRRWDDDQRRYTGDRRWHDDRRHSDRRDGGSRDTDRSGWDQRDRQIRETDRREQTYDRREPDRREVDRRTYENREGDRRVYENREADRRVYESREVERRAYDASPPVDRNVDRRVYDARPPVQQQTIERRDVERRAVEGRQFEGREVTPTRRQPVVDERRTIERQPGVERRTIERRQVEPATRGQSQRREPAPAQGRGRVGRDDNRDGIEDSQQR